MTEPGEVLKSEEKSPLNDDSTRVDIDADESSAHLIKNGGAGDIPDVDEYKTTVVGDRTPASSDGEVSFTGLGKDEVLRYANDPFWVRLRWILFILFWVGWIAMLVTAITIIVVAPRCPPRPDQKWYNTETVYKVLAKSFKDSNGDGVGDHPGMLEKLNYITDTLGAKAIWISSIFKSDNDGENGIIDHKELSEKMNVNEADFINWIKKMRKEGKKIILDLIPNHSSKKHKWFEKFLNGEAPYKDYYISNKTQESLNWKDEKNNSLWAKEGIIEYLHQFSASHPDLNLKNPAVVDEIKNIMKYWFEAGVSGFYIHDLEYLVEDLNDVNGQSNTQDTLQFLEELRKVADDYSDKPGRERALFGFVQTTNRNQTLEYWGNDEKKRLHIVVPDISNIDLSCNSKCVKKLLENILEKDKWLGLQLTNEKSDRVATRLDNKDGNYKKRLTVAHALQLLIQGTPINYYGDEIGQRNGEKNSTLNLNGREVIMSPMQWNTDKYAGFSTVEPWYSVSTTYKLDNVDGELAHFTTSSSLKQFKNLLKLRERESFRWGKTQVYAPNDDLLMFTRKAERFPSFLVLINTGNSSLHVAPSNIEMADVPNVGQVRFHSRNVEIDQEINIADFALNLEPFEIVVFEFPSKD
ncbi:maltase A1 [Biomphalaria pfeifferi]|uniref:Maltase A1 n=1 Tax=Biomphalaria pfeifferi TaxID=112525 RepID=A0AAD8FDH5_BIOPF|nr:maltase A1 [Biomphalaria pfeifferi]